MKRKLAQVVVLVFAVLLVSQALTAAGAAERAVVRDTYGIAVFVPGVVAGSPLYELMVAGAEQAADEYDHVTLRVIEGGFNQAEWEERIMAIAATGDYDLIVTSNGAMPFIALPVAEAFPNQKFLILDAIFEHPQMFTVLYNQFEQAYQVGYLGGLITQSTMSGANPGARRLGMLAGQEYPAMDEMIFPGFVAGAKAVDPSITIDYRVLGNWYDATRAAEMTRSMIDAGADVIMTAAGGANQGVITAAMELGKYVLYIDDDGYHLGPGTIVGSSVLMQDIAAYENIVAAVEGTLEWGTALILSTAEGYVDFVDDSPHYIDAVPEDIRAAMDEMLSRMRSGEMALEVPRFW